MSSIDHPAHYQGEYECIDLMREIYGDEAVRNFCICNAYKYRFRAGKKSIETAQDDIAKAEWYERYMMEQIPKNRSPIICMKHSEETNRYIEDLKASIRKRAESGDII